MISGCSSFHYYTKTFLGYFDTVTTYITYAKSRGSFDEQCDYVEERLQYYDALFDQYEDHDITNVKTINDHAGEAVHVERDLFDLIQTTLTWQKTLSSQVNIALGPVTSIWHRYRTAAKNGIGDVPDQSLLKKAAQLARCDWIKLDEKKQTICLLKKGMALDVGAVAKGYAVEKIKQGLIAQGIESFIISGGGNVAAWGMRKVKKSSPYSNCQEAYCVGVASPQDGNYTGGEEEEAILVANNQSIVTSGDYQRYYVDAYGHRYCHLIDPETLYPASFIRSVSVITADSFQADFLSTALFLMDAEKSLQFVSSLKDVEAVYLLNDGHLRYSSGLTLNDDLYVLNKQRLK